MTVGRKLYVLAFVLLVAAGCTSTNERGETVRTDVGHAVDAGAQALRDNAPANPADLTGWGVAAATALVTGAVVYVKRRRRAKP